MTDVVIVEAVRTPVGRRGGGLSTVHPADLLAAAQSALVERSGIDPAAIGQVVTGCVSQVGEQAFNIGRTAWLIAGLPLSVAHDHGRHPVRVVAAGHQPRHRAGRLAASSTSPSACGVEVMSRVPIGSRQPPATSGSAARSPSRTSRAVRDDLAVRGRRAHRRQVGHHPRRHRRASASASQQHAAQAWAEDRFATQIVADRRPRRRRGGQAHRHHPPRRAGRGPARDHASRSSPTLKPVAREDGVHTAGSSSQISDGAAAVLLMTAERADAARPHARGPHRRHLPRRRRPRAHAHRPDRRHAAPASSAPA